MAFRGSGIGAGFALNGGVGAGGIGSNTAAKSATPGGVYAPKPSSAAMSTHSALWILVLVELVALLALRHAFRHYHGG